MEDKKIIKLLFQRAEQALDLLAARFGPRLLLTARNILSDHQDAEECVSDTYLAAWNSIPPHHPNLLSAYLAKLTRRISISRFRAKHRQKRAASEYALSLDELTQVTDHSAAPEELLEAHVLGEVINRFLQSLTDEERNLFLARYFFLDPLRDAAALYGMSEGKAKSMLFRLRGRLREFLAKEGFEF